MGGGWACRVCEGCNRLGCLVVGHSGSTPVESKSMVRFAAGTLFQNQRLSWPKLSLTLAWVNRPKNRVKVETLGTVSQPKISPITASKRTAAVSQKRWPPIQTVTRKLSINRVGSLALLLWPAGNGLDWRTWRNPVLSSI